jgi:hypothetical protein
MKNKLLRIFKILNKNELYFEFKPSDLNKNNKLYFKKIFIKKNLKI